MIAVIADDFTGAAETGGIGLRYGLKVIIETEITHDHHQSDLLVIDTNTRSLNAREAAKIITQTTKELQKFKPEFIFKKIDSVLRGNITEELTAQMEVSGKKRAIIIPANPVFDRIVRDGIYYIKNVPLHKTRFSSDPEHRAKSSAVLEIIGAGEKHFLINLKSGDKLPKSGLIIGDASDLDDLQAWAMQNNQDTLLAGSSGFFNAILAGQPSLHSTARPDSMPFGKNILFVLGSSLPKDSDLLKKTKDNGYLLSNMPEEIYHNSNCDPSHLENWAGEIVKGINDCHKVVISVFHSPVNGNEALRNSAVASASVSPFDETAVKDHLVSPEHLGFLAKASDPGITLRIRENIGKLIRKVTEQADINELLIEGGSTAATVLKHLNIRKLSPIQELDTGVIRMKTDMYPKLCLTTKPGSYSWPESVRFPAGRPPFKQHCGL